MKKPWIIALAGVLGMSLAGVAGSASAGAAAAPATESARSAVGSVHWGACPSGSYDYAGLGIKCARIAVPLDYRHPHGKKIHLEISRHAHDPSAGSYEGIMLVNPGGPGGSGLVMPYLHQNVPNKVGDRFDWIGFDPRGVGASGPRLNCNPHYFGPDRPSYVPRTPKLMQYWRHKAHQYARDCAHAKAKRLLPHMTTADNARDMNAIRKALGASKMSYYGFSWGSYLGMAYAKLFPHKLKRMVLDGVVDPTRVWYGANLDQDRHFDSNMDVFWHYVAKHNLAFHLGTDWQAIKADYYAQVKKLGKHPAYQGKLGPDELADAMLDAGYYVYGWVDDAKAFAALVNDGNGKPLYQAYKDGNVGSDAENGYAVYNAVQCTDNPWPGWKKTKADSWRVYRTAPFLTWGNTWYNAPCLNWPAAAHHRLHMTGKKLSGHVLLISETKDAATPYSGALETRKLFPTASLIAGVGGTTHAGSLSGVACTDDTIATYLSTGGVPARQPGMQADKKCPPVPAPSPGLLGKRAAPSGLPAVLRQALLAAQGPMLR